MSESVKGEHKEKIAENRLIEQILNVASRKNTMEERVETLISLGKHFNSLTLSEEQKRILATVNRKEEIGEEEAKETAATP